jgi:hypothetical protein
MLAVGKVVEIFDGEGKLKGKAKLIKRSPSRYELDHLPYVKYEKPNDTQEPTLYIWSSERWLVEWVEHSYYRPGDKNMTSVHYYWKTTTDMNSFVDVNSIGNKGVSQEGLYIFLEEDGVLMTDSSGVYSTDAFKALKRVKKAFDGEIIIYTHNPSQVRIRWELNKIPYRILDFIHNEVPFDEAVQEYLRDVDFEEYMILTGVSTSIDPRAIKCGKGGLKLKK